MKLIIITPHKKEEHTVAWIEINTLDGNFVIQKGYAPTTFVLTPEKECIFCFKTGKQESIIPKQESLLNIHKDTATLILATDL